MSRKRKSYKGKQKSTNKSTPNNEKVQIVCVLDSSFSMAETINEARSGFNEYINNQKRNKVNAIVTTAIFSGAGDYDILYSNEPISKVKNVDDSIWYPKGMTALYDAIGKTVSRVRSSHKKMKDHEVPKRVLFVIVTDGWENDSVEFKLENGGAEKIKSLITEMETQHGWNFIYLSSDLEVGAEEGGATIGISKGNTLTFTNDSVGTTYAYGTLSTATSNYLNFSDNTSGTLNMSNILSSAVEEKEEETVEEKE